MKIALVHDYLVQDGGAERVLKAFHEIWPDAPTYTLLYEPSKMGTHFRTKVIHTSFLQNFPFATTMYKWLLPLMPAATESHNLSAYDVVLSSASAFAKGVITRADTLHICYCHTPTRYLWSDTHTFVHDLGVPALVRRILPLALTGLRAWDRIAADRVDKFIANSKTVQRRISKYYGRDSILIHPPVETSKFRAGTGSGGYYLAGGRLVAYKRFDVIVNAFNKLGLPLKIFGVGPEDRRLRAMARPNIEFLGRVRESLKPDLYANAIAYLHPQEEDFGITAVEAMAAGRPVIAYGKGGGSETVINGKTGIHLEEQSWEELANAVLCFEPASFDPEAIRRHAQTFDIEIFKERMKQYVDDSYASWQQGEPSKQAVNQYLHETHRDRHPSIA